MQDMNPFDCLKWAADHQCGGHGPARLVLLVLAGWAGWDANTAEWSCYPSQESIAERALQTTRSVRRNMKLLEDAGAITRHRRWGKGQKGRSSGRYVLHVGGAPIPDTSSGKQDATPDESGHTGEGLPDTDRALTGHQLSHLPDTSVQGTTIELPPELPNDLTTHANGSDPFDEFWAEYPLKQAKGAAKKAWAKLPAGLNPYDVVAAAVAYRNDPNRDPGFTKHPATWLNAGCWEDDPIQSRSTSNTSRAPDRIDTDRDLPGGVLEL